MRIKILPPKDSATTRNASQAHTVVDTVPSNGKDTRAANGEEWQPDVGLQRTPWTFYKGNSVPFCLSQSFEHNIVEGVTKVPEELVTQGVSVWKDYLVGFFLENKLSFPFVKDFLSKRWNLKGSSEMIGDADLFYFRFTNNKDKIAVMEAGHILMAEKIFIVTLWSQEIEQRRKSTKGIPIWVNLFDVPKVLWTEQGLGFVASRLGKPLLTDGATASKKRIAYARVCIEVEFSSELPKSFEVEMKKEDVRKIKVEYSWIPKLCGNYTNFGHFSDNCHWAQEEAMNDTNTTNHGVGRNRRRNKRVWTQKQVFVEQDRGPIPESSCARNDNEVPVHEPGSDPQSDILIDTTETTLVIPTDDPSLTRLGSTHNSIAVVEENNIELTVLMDAITENLMAPGIPDHNKEVLPMATELDDEG
ncbi:hypothetical protein IFM89_018803 [Coptis chinensis]|uniref:DUF4283 domain-containing protein n=1 Tax=Coptis chinensis TaxID=261450 RepID=A0A835LE31_9MAGN|nr:hypothetical protein IFM89_018803 [Coptis chinensis]